MSLSPLALPYSRILFVQGGLLAMSPTLNVNLTSFVIPFKKHLACRFTMLQLLSHTKWCDFSSKFQPSLTILANKKCQWKSYHCDMKKHTTLNTICDVINNMTLFVSISIFWNGHFLFKNMFWLLVLGVKRTTRYNKGSIPLHVEDVSDFYLYMTFYSVLLQLRATSHMSQEPWPWNCKSPKESARRPSQDTSKIM